jgi:hypothetical protein
MRCRKFHFIDLLLKLYIMKKFRFSVRRLYIKIFHWEYWSFHIVYLPIYFYWVWLMIKAGAVFFFNTANPRIKNGGFLMESKKEIYDDMPSNFYPNTLLIQQDIPFSLIENLIKTHNLSLPLIAKPDIGMRGLQVKLLTNVDDLQQYQNNTKVPFLLQQYISYENEIGVFYYRIPGNKNGVVSGIVGKEFLQVIGNGIDTIEALVIANKRFFLQLDTLQKTYGDILQRILSKGEIFTLVPYGNHSRGAKFIDLTHKLDDKLAQAIDSICLQIPHFYYGRLDIKFDNWDALRNGKDFSIIELNGAGSEPTHIYDPKHSIFFAWREIIKHLNILHKISVKNKALLQMSFMTFREGLTMLKENKKQIQLLTST